MDTRGTLKSAEIRDGTRDTLKSVEIREGAVWWHKTKSGEERLLKHSYM